VTALKIELTLLLTFTGLIVGGFIGAIMRARASGSKFANAEREAAQIVGNAKKEAETIIKEADIQSKDVVFKAKAAWDDEVREIRRELHAQEKRLVQKEENLDRKVSQADEKEHDLSRREQSLLDRDRNLQKRTEEAEALVAEQRLKLENLSGITAEEAKQQLMASMESEARHDAAKRIRQIEDEAKEVADKKAKKILSLAIQRFAGDYVAEKTINSVALPSDEMKGRIIGREGRNIRAIEAATGIDLPLVDRPLQMMVTARQPHALDQVLGWVNHGISLKQVPSGGFVIGGGWPGQGDPRTYQTRLLPGSMAKSADTVVTLYPSLAGIPIVRAWLGIEAFCEDEMQIVGQAASVDGLILAAGFSGHGHSGQFKPGIGAPLRENGLDEPKGHPDGMCPDPGAGHGPIY